MGKIKELPKSSSHLLSCTQIISSIQCVVKELIENAIDSSSKNIEIKLENYGLDKIEVKDTGTGIHRDDIDKVAKPHCTSKISSHLDLNHVTTYGFRGEALAAVCTISDMKITTKTQDQDFGYVYTFDQKGDVISTKPFSCTQGTTIEVSNLFKNIPVRKQYYRTDKAKKDELKKIEDTLIAFGCIRPGIRFALHHNRNLIWQKPVVNSIREGLVSVFGRAIVEHMQNCEFADDESQVSIEVFLPKNDAPPTCGHTSSNKSIISINGRPVRMKQIDKVLKEYFNKTGYVCSKSRYPVCYIIIKVPPSQADVNVEPNKTSVMLHNMDLVIEQLTAILKSIYDKESVIGSNNASKNDLNTRVNANYSGNCSSAEEIQTLVSSFEPSMRKSDICVIPATPKGLNRDLNILNSKNKQPSKKLSRQGNSSDTPPTKRMKSCAKQNDIYAHLNTLDSFLNSSGTEQPTSNLESLPGDQTPVRVTVQRESAISPSNVTMQRVNNSEPSNVTMQRVNNSEPSNVTSLFKEVNHQNDSLILTDVVDLPQIPSLSNISKYPHQMTLPFNKDCEPFNGIDLPNTTDVLPNKSSNSLANPNVLDFSLDFDILSDEGTSDCNKNINNSNYQLHPNKSKTISGSNKLQFSSNNGVGDNIKTDKNVKKSTIPFEMSDKAKTLSISGENIKQNKTVANADSEFKTAKSILSCSEIDVHAERLLPTKENLNPIGKPINNSKETIDQNWSRGQSSDSMQPVAVLQPQVAKNGGNDVETGKSAQKASPAPNYRKMTAFDFFCRKYRLEVAALNPERNNHQIAQILTEKWSKLSCDEKAVYKNMVDKDYPKNIKPKEMLGKVVSRNIQGGKSSPSKKKKKERGQIMERKIPFDLEVISNSSRSFTHNLCDPNCENIVCSISPGVWIYSLNNQLFLLNTFRLQEVVIYHRLLQTFRFEPEALEFPCIVSTDSLGKEAMEMITRLFPRHIPNENISDRRITDNGFNINILRGENEVQLQVVGMTRSIAFYGVQDLKEILLLFKENGASTTLSQCRPGKILLYLQSEAVRIARQCPPIKNTEDVEDLLEKRKSLPEDCNNKCIHSEPFVHQIGSIP